MNEEIIQCDVVDIRATKTTINEAGYQQSNGEFVKSSATYCMVCQNVVYVAYILDNGVYHCPSCISEKEINAITRKNAKHDKRDTPETRELKKAMASFKGLGFSDEDTKTRKVTQYKSIGCEHGKWNDEKTVWKWNEKWVCSICKKSLDDEGEVVKNKKAHELTHKEKWDKLLASKKVGQSPPKVTWLLKENRKDD